jgi:ankyrin repeat protein
MDGASPLFIAAEKGHRDIVSLLLDHGADVRQATTNNSMTAMHVAALHGHRKIVSLLLKHGADKSVKATTGHRPVDFARQQGHSALVPLLEP